MDLTTSTPQVLRDFIDVEELMDAVRVSCSLPLLSEGPVSFRGTPMADGSLIESMPYATALAQEATHVLVLRSRPTDFRKDPYPRALIELARRTAHPAVAPMMQARPDRYNAEAEHLQSIAAEDPSLVQIAPLQGTPAVSQIELSGRTIRQGLLAGTTAAAAAFGLPSVDVLWQPEVYDTT